MDKFTDPLIESISLCFGAQIGKTETELNMIGYALHQTVSPTMMVYPTDTIAKFASDKRVQPMIRSVEPLADMYDESSKLLELDFVNGNYMVLVERTHQVACQVGQLSTYSSMKLISTQLSPVRKRIRLSWLRNVPRHSLIRRL